MIGLIPGRPRSLRYGVYVCLALLKKKNWINIRPGQGMGKSPVLRILNYSLRDLLKIIVAPDERATAITVSSPARGAFVREGVGACWPVPVAVA
jgi:hypothetical protein